ncbi:MAG: hypothetical protein MCS20_01650, partial [Candidatus Phytoplasma mali]|nr:hypothetical protein [Candidatus Phytoplasma mali]
IILKIKIKKLKYMGSSKSRKVIDLNYASLKWQTSKCFFYFYFYFYFLFTRCTLVDFKKICVI